MKKVMLLLCKGVEVYEAAAFHDVMGWPGPAGSATIEVVKVGLEHDIRASFGLMLLADVLLSSVKADDFDALALPGGFETHGFYEQAYSAPVAHVIRRFDELKKPIASICVGALALANSGILKGRCATTYRLGNGLRCKQLADFGVKLVDRPVVVDGNVITSAGPATAIDVAFKLLAEMSGEAHAQHVRREMGFA